jgi:hypothetical protein
MSDDGGSVTLVFYRVGSGTEIFKEPFLNLVAAAFQMSSFTHVEIAIGTLSAQHTTHPPLIFRIKNTHRQLKHRAVCFFAQETRRGPWGR